jgi:lipopolysaccharide export system permease protein
MGVLDRYIIRSIAAAALLVLAVLVTLLALFLFIDEQGFVGTGAYGQRQALWFVVKSLPAQIVQFLPMAALIGALVATGNLARQSELTVMRAAGISIRRIGASILLAGLLIVPVAVLIGEFIAPALTQSARMHKAQLRTGNISFAGLTAAWIRDGDILLRAASPAAMGRSGGLTLFRLSADNQLLLIGHARGARELPGGDWELSDYSDSQFSQAGVAVTTLAAKPLNTRINPAFFTVIAGDPADLSLRELRRATEVLLTNGQDARRHRYAFWAKLAQLVAIPLAVLLSVPLLFGSLRSTETGTRTMLGVLFGLGYFILQKMVENGALAFALQPFWLAWLPTVMLSVAVLWQLARLRARNAIF